MSTKFFNITSIANNGFTATQRVAEGDVAGTLSILHMADLKSFTVELEEPSALAVMADKLDNRPSGHTGYVTYLPEIRNIMAEVSDNICASVVLQSPVNDPDLICAEIQFSVTLERSLL